MRIKYFVSVLLVLLSSILLTGCPGPDPSLSGLTPTDTSAGKLLVNVNITENQDDLSGMSTLTFTFQTNVVTEGNYAKFADQETITCNGVPLQLKDQQRYSLQVSGVQVYHCTYVGYTKGIGKLPAVTMVDVPAGSKLVPQRPKLDSQGYTVSYTPDTKDHACSPTTANNNNDGIKADATDGSTTISGPEQSSAQGSYQGPNVSSLSGAGNIHLTRTCSSTSHSPFDTVNVTYQSTASVDVTWG